MASWYRITELVVGRAAADRYEQKRLDRKYKHVEDNLKLGVSCAPEPTISHTRSLTASELEDSQRPSQLERRPPVPVFNRSLSAPVMSEKTYGESMMTQTMVGVGRYQQAINLPLEVRLRKLDEQIHAPDRLRFNPYCNTPPPCVDGELWEIYKARRCRDKIFYPSKLAPYEVRSRMIEDERIDLRTGTRTNRGFSSTASSRCQSEVTTASSNGPRTPADPVEAEKATARANAMETPCDELGYCTENSNNESAIESDDEDLWSDVDEAERGFARTQVPAAAGRRVSKLTEGLARLSASDGVQDSHLHVFNRGNGKRGVRFAKRCST